MAPSQGLDTQARRSAVKAGFLRWMFRGYETYVLVVALEPILEGVLSPYGASALYYYAGLAVGLTLFGWALGGVLRGVLVNWVGAKWLVTGSVLGYTLLTGLTALAGSIAVFFGFRFLTGVALGSDGEGSLARAAALEAGGGRTRGVGRVRAGFGVGVCLASLAWLALYSLGPQAWRYLFALGAVPALAVVYLRRAADRAEKLPTAAGGIEDGSETATESETRTDSERSSMLAERLDILWTHHQMIVCVILFATAVVGWWGIAIWIPTHVGTIAQRSGFQNTELWASLGGIAYGVGTIAGCLVLGPIADRIGRTSTVVFWFIGALAITATIFLWIRTPLLILTVVSLGGAFTGGVFAWFAIYPSGLFPASVRERALGTAFVLARLLAAGFPVAIGALITFFEGIPAVAAAATSIYSIGIVAALALPHSEMDERSTAADVDPDQTTPQ